MAIQMRPGKVEGVVQPEKLVAVVLKGAKSVGLKISEPGGVFFDYLFQYGFDDESDPGRCWIQIVPDHHSKKLRSRFGKLLAERPADVGRRALRASREQGWESIYKRLFRSDPESAEAALEARLRRKTLFEQAVALGLPVKETDSIAELEGAIKDPSMVFDDFADFGEDAPAPVVVPEPPKEEVSEEAMRQFLRARVTELGGKPRNTKNIGLLQEMVEELEKEIEAPVEATG